MQIDQSFFPNTDGLTTYIDETPHFNRKQLEVLGSPNDEGPKFEDIDGDQFQETETNDASMEQKFSIEKIFHAQCLENYPNHFVAFIRLSQLTRSMENEKSLHSGISFISIYQNI